MCGERCSCLVIYQLLCISVVSADEQYAVHLLDCVYSSSHTGVYGLDCLDRSILNSRMANHIRVREVDDDNVVFSGLDRFHQLVTNSRGAHLWLKVVGSHLRRWNQNSVLTLIRLLDTAVKEECHMCVLLCLGNSGLGHVVVCKELAKGIHNGFLLKCNQLICNGVIIIGKAYIR